MFPLLFALSPVKYTFDISELASLYDGANYSMNLCAPPYVQFQRDHLYVSRMSNYLNNS